MKGYWTCRRKFMGKQCLTTNPNRKRNCEGCGKPRQKRKPPEHRAVLAFPYEWWVDRFGETCGICGKGPSAGRRLDRDHDHKSGAARGLLCHKHNRGLDWFADLDELRRAVVYLEIAERRRLAAMLDGKGRPDEPRNGSKHACQVSEGCMLMGPHMGPCQFGPRAPEQDRP